MSVVVEATPFPIAQPSLPKADPCVIVIFGASGDLTKRKLVPALFHMACTDCLSGPFKVLGVGRGQMSDDEFRDRMREGATGSNEIGEFSDATWRAFAARLHYMAGDPSDIETYHRVAARLEQMTLQRV